MLMIITVRNYKLQTGMQNMIHTEAKLVLIKGAL